MAQYDGSIRINTSIDANGIRQGEKEIKGSMSRVSNSAKIIEKSMGRVSSAAKKFAGIIASAFAIGKIAQFGKEMLELGSDLQEVQNVVDVTFATMSKKVDEFAKNAAVSAGLSETMAKKYVGTFGAMAKSFGFSEQAAYDMSTALTQLSGDVASFYNITQDEAYIKLKSVFTGETETLKDLGVVMTQSALDAYALANGFGKTTSAMSENEKVALRFQFVMQQLSGASGDFMRTSSGWANQVRILKLQFESLKATIGQGLINVFTPVIKIINVLLGKLATLANAFKAFTELITGNKSKSGGSVGLSKGAGEDIGAGYNAAADGAENLAAANDKAAKSAGKAAKAAKGQLSTLDKLNNLSSESSGAGGGGGAGGSGAGGGISGAIEDVDYGTLAEGETIADKLSESLSNIWSVFEQAWKNKGEGVVSSANYALQSLKTAADSVGATFYEVFTNGTGLTWLESGLELLGSMLGVIGSISAAFSTAWNSGAGFENVTALFNMFTNINTLITSIGDSFSRVFSNGTGVSIWTNILGIITGVYNIIGNLSAGIDEAWNTAGLGDSIWQGALDIINSILETIHDITDSTATWAEQLDFTPLLTSIDTLLKAIEPLTENIGEGLEWFWNNVLLPIAAWTIQEAVPVFLDELSAAIDVVNSVIESLKPLGTWLWENFLQPLGEWYGDAAISWMETITDLLTKFSDWISENKSFVEDFVIVIGSFFAAWEIVNLAPIIASIVASLTAFVTTGGLAASVASLLGGAIAFLTSPITIATAIIGSLIAIGVLLYKNWDKIKEAAEKLGAKIKEKWEEIKSSISDAWKNIQTSLSNVPTWFKGKFDLAVKNIKSAFSGVTGYFKGVWSNIKAVFGNIAEWFQKKFASAWTAVKNVFSTGGKIFDGIKDGILNGLKTVINGIISGINKVIAVPFNGLNAALKELKSISIAGAKPFGFLPDISVPQIPKLATGTVVPPNREFLAVLGDNKREPEVVSPLSTMKQANKEAMMEVLSELGLNSRNGRNGGNETFVFQVDGKTFFEIMRKEAQAHFSRTGSPAFPI